MDRAAQIAADICPFRAEVVRVIGSMKPRPFFAIDREVSVRTRGMKLPEDFRGYIKLSDDPLFEHYGVGPDDDMWGLSPLGAQVHARLAGPSDTESKDG